MNYLKTLSLLLLALAFASCEKEPEPVASSMSVTPSVDLNAGVCVGVKVDFAVSIKTDPTVGIAEFSISKNGTVVQENASISANNLTIDYSFTPNSEDLARGNAEFTFSAKDKSGKLMTESLNFNIETEYSFRVDNMAPQRSWDMVKNEAVSDSVGANVDVYLRIETRPCGPFCTNIRLTMISRNDTEYIPIPFDQKVNYFSNETKSEDIEALIAGANSTKELILYSEFAEDVTSNGNLLNAPMIIKLRGKNSYAVFDYAAVASEVGQLLYKKTSESAGE